MDWDKVKGFLSTPGNPVLNINGKEYPLKYGAITPDVPYLPGMNAAKEAAGLEMSQAARMSRAADMGFDTDTPFYHGTSSDITEFKSNPKGANKFGEGIYFAPDPGNANRYAVKPGGNVIASYLKNENSLDLSNPEEVSRAYSEIGIEAHLLPRAKVKKYGGDEYNNFNELVYSLGKERGIPPMRAKAALIEELRNAGYTGITSPGDEIQTVFKPEQVRSVNAAFDPKNSNSAKILAGGAAGAGFLTAGAPQAEGHSLEGKEAEMPGNNSLPEGFKLDAPAASGLPQGFKLDPGPNAAIESVIKNRPVSGYKDVPDESLSVPQKIERGMESIGLVKPGQEMLSPGQEPTKNTLLYAVQPGMLPAAAAAGMEGAKAAGNFAWQGAKAAAPYIAKGLLYSAGAGSGYHVGKKIGLLP